MMKAVDAFITANPPNRYDVYYTFYATNVMFQLGGKSWREWNAAAAQGRIDARGPRDHPGGPSQ